MRPIRVMHILSDMEMGGAQRVVCDIVANLDRSRFRPHVCCLRSGGSLIARLEDQRVPHHLVYFSSRLSLIGLVRLQGLLRELDIDVVHTHLRRANLSGRLAAVLAGTPVRIAHAHDVLRDTRSHHGWIARWLAKRTDRVLCISDAVATVQMEVADMPRDRVETLHNFIDPNAFRSDISPQLAKADLGLAADGPCVGIVGRLHPVKRHDLFLDAAFRLNQDRPDVNFVVVGEGKLRDTLKEKARQLGMAHKVAFVGRHAEVARVYRALDCVVVTSDSEGLGMVILEAQAAGVPVVARAVGGTPEALAGGGGRLVNESRPEAIASAIRAALTPATAAHLRRQMPENLRRFDAGRQITRLEDLYEDLCHEHGIG